MHLYDRNWEAVASLVPTRTVLQIRTHSQKYFTKMEKGEEFPGEVRAVWLLELLFYALSIIL